MLSDLAGAVRKSVARNDWQRYHTPKNLALAICSEAGELGHLYRWTEIADREQVLAELADVLIFSVSLCNVLGVDPERIALDKLARNGLRETDGPNYR